MAYAPRAFTLPIFYGDLDTNGHVNNVAYGRFFEHARYTTHHEIGLVAGLGKGSRLLVARVAIDYLAESTIGEPLVVRVRLGSFGRTSLIEEMAAWQGDVCVALAEIVMVHQQGGVAAPWTDPLREAFGALSPAG